jgi:hypothetical protein
MAEHAFSEIVMLHSAKGTAARRNAGIARADQQPRATSRSTLT